MPLERKLSARRRYDVKINCEFFCKTHNDFIFILNISQYVIFTTVKDESKKSKISLELLQKSIVLLHQGIMGTRTIKMDPTWASLVQGDPYQQPPKHQLLEGRALKIKSHSQQQVSRLVSTNLKQNNLKRGQAWHQSTRRLKWTWQGRWELWGLIAADGWMHPRY